MKDGLYTPIPNEIIDDKDLNATEKILFITLIRYASTDKKFENIDDMADLIGVNKSEINKIYNNLQEKLRKKLKDLK